jgi:hypothetical protein
MSFLMGKANKKVVENNCYHLFELALPGLHCELCRGYLTIAS